MIWPLNGGQEVIYKVAGPFGAAQGGGNTDCGVPVGATSVEINIVAVNALNEGNLRVTDGSLSSTGGVVNYNDMSPKLNTANAVIVPLNASGRLVVIPNCGPGCTADTTEVRGVVLGYFTTALAQRVAALETLLTRVTRTTHNGYDTLRLNQVNLQLVNGTGDTLTGNGYGNLIVGYDRNANTYARTGSHDVVVGNDHGWSRSGGVVFGYNNRITANMASVTGGSANIASGGETSVSGGNSNESSGTTSSVSGGLGNKATSYWASISGGIGGTAGTGNGPSISGGWMNQATGEWACVSGGRENVASGQQSSVFGGNFTVAPSTDDWAAGTLFQDG